jgi:hypothetical protein
MWRVAAGMTNTFAAQARTALSPEWDRGFDEAFTDLVTADRDWVRDEFDALIGANFNEPPEPRHHPPRPPAARTPTIPTRQRGDHADPDDRPVPRQPLRRPASASLRRHPASPPPGRGGGLAASRRARARPRRRWLVDLRPAGLFVDTAWIDRCIRLGDVLPGHPLSRPIDRVASGLGGIMRIRREFSLQGVDRMVGNMRTGRFERSLLGAAAGVAGFFSRRMAKTALPVASAAVRAATTGSRSRR